MLTQLKTSLKQSAVASIFVIIAVLVLEPVITSAQTSTFTISQNVTAEISFLVAAANVTMAGSLAGMTGGNATGTTFAVVRTNNNTGYQMSIAFSTTTAMRGNVTGSQAIRDYVATEPSFAFTASSAALFAYTVTASTTSDLDQSFLDNGTACNTGSNSTAGACWMGASTTNFRIVNRTTEAGTGATTTIQFKVNIPSDPIPSVTEDIYTATATLTAVMS